MNRSICICNIIILIMLSLSGCKTLEKEELNNVDSAISKIESNRNNELGVVKEESKDVKEEIEASSMNEKKQKLIQEDMIQRSLLSSGNNYRIKKVMERATKGEEITIAYIGGSITEGAGASVYPNCYAYQSYLNFTAKYGTKDGSNIKIVNAGMGGTPSSLGMIRYDRDVTNYGTIIPDVVFIEFAVNDYEEPTGGEAYESMIRKVLKMPNQPVVILVFSVFKTKWNMQEFYKPLGDYYELPMISIKDALVTELEVGNITEEEYFADEYHPKDFGHKIMTDCIEYYYDTVASQEMASTDARIPDKPLIGNDYEELQILDNQVRTNEIKVEAGSFSSVDKELVGLFYDVDKRNFPDNWKHQGINGDKSLKMTLKCKNLLLVYKASNKDSYGEAQVYIDGDLVGTYNGYDKNGWNNPITVVLLKEKEVKEHQVEIKMSDKEKEFTIYAFGYTK